MAMRNFTGLLRTRRVVLQACLAAAVPIAARGQDEDDPARKARPKKGDLLVFSEGDRAGQVIKPTDVVPGQPQVLAWAFDPAKKVPRDGSRLNQVLLVHVDAAKLSGPEESHAAGGIVAFSATCTHQQCPVTEWLSTSQHLQCPCHQSEYDPLQNCKVVAGPAPRPLPPLPLALVNGELQVAGPFIGRVGGQAPGMG
jgi:Rieske Fe-S protein